MSEKSFRKSEFKRTIDLGKTDRGQDTDLIRVWRESSGEEKAISLGDINGGLIGDYVPYTGAVDDVDLGEKGISAGYVKYDTTPTSTPTDQGTSYWDVDDNTLAIIMNGTTLKVGEDQYYPVKNQTGVLIPKGTAVRFAGTLGASGRLLIAPFLADGSIPSSRFMGVTSEDIANGADGKVMWFGRIRGINTNAFNEGDVLYASTTVAGGFQTTVPVAPNNIVEVCAVIHKSVSNGIIFVRPTFITSVQAGAGLSLDSLNQIQLGNDGAGVVDISDRDIFEEGFVIKDNGVNSGNRFSLLENELNLELYEVDPIGGDSELFLDWGASIFRAKVTYFPIEGGKKIQTISIGSNGKGGGIRNPFLMIITDEINSKGFEYTADYSANWTDHSLVTKSWVLGQVSGSAHNPVTIGTPANGLSIDGSQVLTIGLASTSATGALSSTDWNTFNNKLNLTSPITGYTLGSNTALAATDTILQAFGKVQGQINARISGTIASGQVAFGTGVNTIGGGSGLVWDNTAKILRVNTTDGTANLSIGGSLNVGDGTTTYRIINSGGTAITGTTTNHGLVIRTNLTTRINITADGLVAIGNIPPTQTLDVNGTARIRTISNLGTATTSVLVPSATGVISLRTLAELASDMGTVTLAGTQTITGAKTFNNSLLIQSGSNPVFRIATTDNIATVNFRNVFNEDAATIQMSTPATELALSTNVSNYDIRIQPHGTGKIKLPNVPTGTGDFLGRDASNNLVIVSGVSGSESSITPTLSDSGGGATYTFTQSTSWYYKVGRVVHFSMYITGISTTGTPTGSFRIAGLPRPSNNVGGYIDHSIGLIGQFAGSDLTTSELNMAYFDIEDNVSSGRLVLSLKDNVNPPTSFTDGIIQVSGTYIVN